ncbi:HD-GYP domain-containing protein [bacterium]|nr:HD-GYP domain-containing protein [bacterium]
MPEKYIPIPLRKIIVDSIPDFDLYLSQNSRFVLYKKGNYRFEQENLDSLIENNVSSMFVQLSDYGRFERYSRKAEGQGKDKKDSGRIGQESLLLFHNELREHYFVIDPKVIPAGAVLDFPIFLRNSSELQAIPDSCLDSDCRWEFKGKGDLENQELFIGRESLLRYRQIVEQRLRDIDTDSSANGNRLLLKAVSLREFTKLILQDLLDDPTSSARMTSLKNVINYMVDFILQHRSAFHSLMVIHSHDLYTYVHSVNVCTFSVALGATIGLPLYPDIYILGLGGMLHDLGKKKIDPVILNKPEALTEGESETVRKHVMLGVNMLRQHKDVPEEVVRMVFEHHERLDGSGYPRKLKGEQISMFGRIAAIVDVYDTMTTDYPYRKKYRPFDALNHLHLCSGQFDPNLTREFILLLGRQFEQNGIA